MIITKKSLAGIFIAAAFILGGAAMGNAQEQDGAPGLQPYGQQLTPEQMAQARKIFDKSYADMEGTRQALASKRMELDQQLASPNPDRSRIEALSREIGELRGKMLSSRVEVRNSLAAQGLPPDCFGRGYGPANGQGYGPCWGGMMGRYPDNGWYHHHGHGGWGGHRGGCWR